MKSLNGLVSSIDVKRLRPNNIAIRDMLISLVNSKNIPSVKTIEYKDIKLGRTRKVKFYKIDAIRAALVGKAFYSRIELQKQLIELLEELEEEQESHTLIEEFIELLEEPEEEQESHILAKEK